MDKNLFLPSSRRFIVTYQSYATYTYYYQVYPCCTLLYLPTGILISTQGIAISSHVILIQLLRDHSLYYSQTLSLVLSRPFVLASIFGQSLEYYSWEKLPSGTQLNELCSGRRNLCPPDVDVSGDARSPRTVFMGM